VLQPGGKQTERRAVAVFARQELVGRTSISICAAGFSPAVLLEGGWPEHYGNERFLSLDESLGSSARWIDQLASKLAEKAAPLPWLHELRSPYELNALWVYRLALSYQLVKLLRVAVFFRQLCWLRPGDRMEVFLENRRDQPYRPLLEQVAQQVGAACCIHWLDSPPVQSSPQRHNLPLRSWLEWINERFSPGITGQSTRRVFLLGSNARLGPVCNELLARGARVWWLADRLPVKLWLRWRPLGAGVLVCRSDRGIAGRPAFRFPSAICWDQIDLTESVAQWLSERIAVEGPALVQLAASMDRHFRRHRPQVVLLDEDATPFARTVVACAKRWGARSYVVQHGAPYCRFGFAPLAADGILAWGTPSAERLLEWDVSDEQVRVVGCPLLHLAPVRNSNTAGGDLVARTTSSRTVASRRPISFRRPATILLLATVPPRDHRPDSVSLQLTTGTYRQLLRETFDTIGRLGAVRLLIKPHPRAPSDSVLEQLVRSGICRARFVSGSLRRLIARADCVLSFMSSAGVEAAQMGVPVVQLAPPGSDCLPAQRWALAGTAHNGEQLYRLLQTILHRPYPPRREHSAKPFAATGQEAARRIAAVVLQEQKQRCPRPELLKLDVQQRAAREQSSGHTARTSRPEQTVKYVA